MKKLALVVLAVIFVFAVMGCKGGDGGSNNGENNYGVIPSTTKVLDQTTMQSISSVSSDQSTIIFSSTTPMLQVLSSGDVMAFGISSQTPNGLLRKVINVAQAGNQVIVTTTQATLEDAIQECNISVEQTLSPSSVSSVAALAPGVKIMSAVASAGTGSFNVSMNNVVLYDAGGGQQVAANGSISFQHSHKFTLRISGSKLIQLYFADTSTESAQIGLTSNVQATSLQGKRELARYTFATIPITIPLPPPSPVPFLVICIRPIVVVSVGFNGDVSVGISANVNQNASWNAGLSYVNSQWQPINDFSKTFSFATPSISSNVAVQAYVGPELDLMIEGVIGPTAGVNGYLELNANTLQNPWWQLYAGLSADIGVKMAVLGHSLADHSQRVIDYKTVLAQAAPNVPIILASGLSKPVAIISDSTNVYWVEPGDQTGSLSTGVIKKVSVNGGTPTTLASGLFDPYTLAVDSTSVYWTEVYGGTLKKVSINGGTPTILATGLTFPSYLTLDSSNVYWVAGATISKVSKNGGARYIITTLSEPTLPGYGISVNNISVDAQNVYWAEDCTLRGSNARVGLIKKAILSGSSPITIASGSSYPILIGVDVNNVYFGEASINISNRGSIKSISLNNGAVTTIVSGLNPWSFAADSANIYFTENNSTIEKVQESGGTPITLYTANTTLIAIDSTNVYWADWSGNLMKGSK